MEERKSLLDLIAKMSAGGDADKITRLEDPEVMNAMQKKYADTGATEAKLEERRNYLEEVYNDLR